jgi:hypothetical protein
MPSPSPPLNHSQTPYLDAPASLGSFLVVHQLADLRQLFEPHRAVLNSDAPLYERDQTRGTRISSRATPPGRATRSHRVRSNARSRVQYLHDSYP